MTGLIQVDARFIRSSFGGGWIVPDTDEGRDWLEAYFNDAPAWLEPISSTGWMVEPYAVEDLALSAAGQIYIVQEA